MSHRILRLPAVKSRTGLSPSTIYSHVANKQFPAPISLGARAVGWLEQDIEAWLTEKVEASRKAK
jgi:prophage regulatory protein